MKVIVKVATERGPDPMYLPNLATIINDERQTEIHKQLERRRIREQIQEIVDADREARADRASRARHGRRHVHERLTGRPA
jgi:hypothetical protein